MKNILQVFVDFTNILRKMTATAPSTFANTVAECLCNEPN